jgi:hypothetical protein
MSFWVEGVATQGTWWSALFDQSSSGNSELSRLLSGDDAARRGRLLIGEFFECNLDEFGDSVNFKFNRADDPCWSHISDQSCLAGEFVWAR